MVFATMTCLNDFIRKEKFWVFGLYNKRMEVEISDSIGFH
jgi:hypothetical protein